MSTLVRLTKVSTDSLNSPLTLEDLERKAMDAVHAQCLDVKWLHSDAMSRPYDYVDVFEAPDHEGIVKVSLLLRGYGHTSAEVSPAVDWKTYKGMIERMPELRE